jgi:cation diffusion facilitator family transporter
MEKNIRLKYAYIEGTLSIIINILLFLLKYWAGILSGSIAIIADAWHSLSDSLTSIVVIISSRETEKPADTDHPFGHGRAELIGSIIIGVLLAIVGFNFLGDSFKRLLASEARKFPPIVFGVIFLSVVVKEGSAQYAFWCYRKTGTHSLKADGWHHRSDAITSLFILIGIFVNKYFWWIDGVLGICVSLVLIFTAWKIIKEGSMPLLGENPDESLVSEITEVTRECCNTEIYMHHFHLHRYGHHTEITFHICLPGEKSIEEGHYTATLIEENIREKLSIEATIHVEPVKDHFI